MSDDFNFEVPQQPLKRSASVGPGTNVSAIYVNPSSPSGSDLSDSSLSGFGSGHVFRPLALTGGISPPVQQIETLSAAAPDPPTSLTLSLPGSSSAKSPTQNSKSVDDPTPSLGAAGQTVQQPTQVMVRPPPPPPPPSPPPPLAPAPPTPMAPPQAAPVAPPQSQGGFVYPVPAPAPMPGQVAERQFFSPEFLGVLQEMIRKEVRSYMSGIEQNGMCMQTEAIRNAVVKRIGISKID